MAQYQGQISDWQKAKGFGFITPQGGGKRIFFHLNAWLGNRQQIQTQQVVKYDLTTDTKGRICALNVAPIANLIDGMQLQAVLVRYLPEKKLALLSHADYPNTQFILPQAALQTDMPAIGSNISGVLKLHSSGHWLMLQAQVQDTTAAQMNIVTNMTAASSSREQKVNPKQTTSTPTGTTTKASSLASGQKTQANHWYDGIRLEGLLQDWNDEKGYGFVVVDGHSKQVFFHINDYIELNGRPKNGMKMRFNAKQEGGRWRAEAVQCLSAPAAIAKNRRHRGQLQGEPIKIIVAVLVALLFLAYISHYNKAVALWMLVVSVVSFVTYRTDKQAALKNAWRVPENKLHFLDLIGGWPGGLIARQLWRHKTTKTSFVVTFWLTVIINIIASNWLMRYAANYLPM